MGGLTDSPRPTALMTTSLLARLPLAMLSIALLVDVHRDGEPPLAACVRALPPVIVTDPGALSAAYTLETTALELTFIAGPPLALGRATGLSTRAPLIAGAIILIAATSAFAAQPASRHWQGRGRPAGRRAGALRPPAIRNLALILVAVGIVFGAVDVAVAASTSAQHAIGDAGPLLGIWGFGSLIGGITATRAHANTTTRRP